MAGRPTVAVLVESSRSYGRGLLRGVATYIQEHRPWTIHFHERRLYDPVPRWMNRWNGDGIIARIAAPGFARRIARLGKPTVDLIGLQAVPGVPAIITDHQSVSQLAADHLLSRGLKHFAFCGFSGIHFSEMRAEYFVHYLHTCGYTTSVYVEPRPRGAMPPIIAEAESLPRARHIAAWLKSLPKPVGLMAATDYRGHHVLNVCGEYGFSVPDEIAVVGVDNDEMLCSMCDPPLSSVALDPHRAGYEAAALLDRMLQGEPAPEGKQLVPPLGVVARRSTDVLSIADADLAAALRFIHARACEGISVEDVLREVPVSRSTLKRRFAAALRRSVHDEIRRVQIERVRELLSTTDLTLAKIAEQTGFPHVESMCKLFRQKTGDPPGHYRKLWRTNGGR